MGGHRKILPSYSGVKKKKIKKLKQKKGLQPGRFHSFGAQVSLGGAQRNLMVQTSLFAHKFRGEHQKKKGLMGEILGSVFVFTRVFLPGAKFYSRFRGHYFGGEQVPKFTPVAPGLLLSFGAHFLLGGSASSDFGGTAPKCPPWRPA